MTTNYLDAIHKTLAAYMELTYRELAAFSAAKQLEGQFQQGAWVGGNNRIAVGGVIYFPHANASEEEGLCIEISVQPDENKKLILCTAWLGWTHGPIIEEYLRDKEIAFGDAEELLNGLTELLDGHRTRMTSDMEREMLIDHPPIYRK